MNSSFLIPFSYSNLWLRLFICIFLLSPQTCSAAKSCPTLQPHGLQHTRLPCPSLSPGVSKLMSIELVMPSNRLILCHSLLPSVFPYIKVFSSESALHIKWPKYWSFSIRPEYSELISLLQGTLKNLLQHHNSIPYSFHCLKTVTFATLASVTSCLFSQILRLCFWPL